LCKHQQKKEKNNIATATQL